MTVHEYHELTSHEMEAMLFTVDGSLKVHKRFQFFLWSQGSLHRFIPHETLLCAWGDVLANRFRYEIFSQNVAHEQATHEWVDPINGCLAKLVDEWRRRGSSPCLLTESNLDAWPSQLADCLRRNGLGHALAHGAKEMNGDSGSFFVFLNMPNAPTPREAYMSELLMPYMHMAVHRMASNGLENISPTVSADTVLSDREVEVLRWVRDGKTNHEIGQILDISPLTVKNHVQKILRKLNATNRAQAVAKGLGSKLFAFSKSEEPVKS